MSISTNTTAEQFEYYRHKSQKIFSFNWMKSNFLATFNLQGDYSFLFSPILSEKTADIFV